MLMTGACVRMCGQTDRHTHLLQYCAVLPSNNVDLYAIFEIRTNFKIKALEYYRNATQGTE